MLDWKQKLTFSEGTPLVYDNEFALLKETFKKSRLPIVAVSPDSPATEAMEDWVKPFFANLMPKDMSLRQALGEMKPRVLYRFRDSLSLSYLAFLMESSTLILIGPYADTILDSNHILEISEKNNISPQHQKLVNDFFSSVPVISENSALFLLLDAFCERIWNGIFEVADVQSSRWLFEPTAPLNSGEIEIDDTFLSMQNMERRYQFENEMIEAVAMGLEHKVSQLLSGFNDNAFEKRLTDPLRNIKNYGIIMNTLLRKAAEQGGVHPVYLDKLSSRFAMQIEAMPSLSQGKLLMTEMFRSYCRLVKKHSAKGFSSVVKKAVVLIETNPATEMNLHILAKKLGVSNGYLSAIFKKETGKTITQYIHHKRLSYAQHLLKSTNLQVQTVALHCGMVDVQYFSKLFKREFGISPSQYRTAK